ncbi:hypothetical protein [Glycomyces artemisiae]|uniref:Uncharacterized protein n=1 Tax=Glycomyces artemisiae TaxID=1076443 RepID=A0A2T0UQ11_9ACTN|nr:hypothetical protein [Glycomyces artemisiae]PRY60010.1 hypothetical protein B0I28_103484 [Glycomyces artemisiae]
MPKFATFQSMMDDEPPTKDELKEMIATFGEPLQMLYIRSRYDAFFNERYPAGSSIQNPSDTWIFDFDTHMTAAEDEELRSMCWPLATNFVIDLLMGVDNLVDKVEGDLDAMVADLLALATSYGGAMTDAKLTIVQERLESWHGEAGAAIRERYSDHLTRSTQAHQAMANALANAAKLDSLILMKVRHHLDGLIRATATAIDNGPAGPNLNIEPIIGWLTFIGVIVSAPGGPAVMSTVGWVGSTIKTILTELPLEQTDEPTMDSPDPDELREQMLAALAQVAEVVKADREKLAGELITAFEECAALVASTDPAESSRVIPNPNGVDGIAL